MVHTNKKVQTKKNVGRTPPKFDHIESRTFKGGRNSRTVDFQSALRQFSNMVATRAGLAGATAAKKRRVPDRSANSQSTSAAHQPMKPTKKSGGAKVTVVKHTAVQADKLLKDIQIREKDEKRLEKLFPYQVKNKSQQHYVDDQTVYYLHYDTMRSREPSVVHPDVMTFVNHHLIRAFTSSELADTFNLGFQYSSDNPSVNYNMVFETQTIILNLLENIWNQGYRKHNIALEVGIGNVNNSKKKHWIHNDQRKMLRYASPFLSYCLMQAPDGSTNTKQWHNARAAGYWKRVKEEYVTISVGLSGSVLNNLESHWDLIDTGCRLEFNEWHINVHHFDEKNNLSSAYVVEMTTTNTDAKDANITFHTIRALVEKTKPSDAAAELETTF